MQSKAKLTIASLMVVVAIGVVGLAGYVLLYPSTEDRAGELSSSPISLSAPTAAGKSRDRLRPPQKSQPALQGPRQPKSKLRKGRRIPQTFSQPDRLPADSRTKIARDIESLPDSGESRFGEIIPAKEAQQRFDQIMLELDTYIASGKKLPFKQRRQLLEQAGQAFGSWSATLNVEEPGDAAELEAAYLDFQMRASQLGLTEEPPPPRRRHRSE